MLYYSDRGWDSPSIKDEGARFEIMAAIEFYRAVSSRNDMGYGDFGLLYVKNKEQQEVDFLLVKDGHPFLLAISGIMPRSFVPQRGTFFFS